MSPHRSKKPLNSWRVLVPRGGEWGNTLAANLRSHGASPLIAPMVNFASAEDTDALNDAIARLQAGAFDWLIVSSPTTVDVLHSQGVTIPANTRVAAMGETTAFALRQAAFRVDFVPEYDRSPRGFVKEWPEMGSDATALVFRSDIEEPSLEKAVGQLGLRSELVIAYRTIGVQVEPDVAAEVANGGVSAILITSGSVARQVKAQLAPLPEGTIVAAIGPRTAWDSRTLGIEVDLIAETRTPEGLIEALIERARGLA